MSVLGSIATLTSGSKQDREAVLLAKVESLSRANQDLQAALHAAHTGAITMQGYLSKHRPVTQLMGLFAQEWELRYFILTGSVLRYYKSERDAALTPRGVVDVQGYFLQTEDSSHAGAWRFRIVKPDGHVLMRLSTDNKAAAEKWMSCLERAGLRLLGPGGHVPVSGSRDEPSYSSSSPARGSGNASPDKRQQDRWEACSTDSELPEVPQKHIKPRAGKPPPNPAVHSNTAAAAAAAAVAQATTTGTPTADQAADTLQTVRRGDVAGGAAARGAAAGRTEHHASRPPMLGSTPVCTTTRYSFLSSDGVWRTRHDGLLNLAIIILVVANFRLILENLLKYGWRLNFISYVRRSLSGSGNLPVVLAFPALVAFSLISLATEKLGVACLKAEEQYKQAFAKRDLDEKQAAQLYKARVRQSEMLLCIVNAVNTSAALLLPCFVIHWTQAEAAPGFLLTLCTLTVWMKLVSYAHCHYDLRGAHRANLLRPGERGAPESDPSWATMKFPENLTVRNMMYYLAVPTLTYQVNFPTTNRIRKRWLMRRFIELACFSGLMVFIVTQYLEPSVSNAIMPLSQSDYVRVIERVLKLALPMMYTWLCMFYCLFHLWLNILAELTYFGDREFYKDWWNAATIGDYWRSWNMPVHKWLLRTVYFPAMRAGVSRYSAMVLVFFVSAVFHEVVVGVPLHMINFWAFTGIMLQVPLISLTENLKKHLKNDTWGNTIFWTTFCIVGQPVALLVYVHDYLFKNVDHGRGLHAGAGGDYLRDA